MEVLGPKGPKRYSGDDLVRWARNQLLMASQIVDNPGGGLLFATQVVGQVKASLSEEGGERWRDVVAVLDEAEDHAVRRRFGALRELLERARHSLAEEQPAET